MEQYERYTIVKISNGCGNAEIAMVRTRYPESDSDGPLVRYVTASKFLKDTKGKRLSHIVAMRDQISNFLRENKIQLAS